MLLNDVEEGQLSQFDHVNVHGLLVGELLLRDVLGFLFDEVELLEELDVQVQVYTLDVLFLELLREFILDFSQNLGELGDEWLDVAELSHALPLADLA